MTNKHGAGKRSHRAARPAARFAERVNQALRDLEKTFNEGPPERVSEPTIVHFQRIGILPSAPKGLSRKVAAEARYSERALWRVIVTRRLQGIAKSSGDAPVYLEQIRDLLDTCDDSRLKAIALGEEPIHLGMVAPSNQHIAAERKRTDALLLNEPAAMMDYAKAVMNVDQRAKSEELFASAAIRISLTGRPSHQEVKAAISRLLELI